VTRRRGRRHEKLLNDLKDRREYSHLKEEAVDLTIWRNRFGGIFGPVVRQNTEWMNEWMNEWMKFILEERKEGLDERRRCRCISDSLLALRLKFHRPETGPALYADSVRKWSRLLHCLIRKASFILWVHWRSASGKGKYSLRS